MSGSLALVPVWLWILLAITLTLFAGAVVLLVLCLWLDGDHRPGLPHSHFPETEPAPGAAPHHIARHVWRHTREP